MNTIKWIFRAAGIFGVAIITPMIFLESRLAQDFPPPLAHPEFYYGFIATCLAWQLMYLLISTDPVRYRAPMLLGAASKLSFVIAVVVLFMQSRVAGTFVALVAPDAVFAALFIYAWYRTPRA